jgi:hypothetical protein
LSVKAKRAQYQGSRKEELSDQRRAAKEVDVDIGKGAEHLVRRHASKGDRHGQDGAEHDGNDDQLQRDPKAAQIAGPVLDHLLAVVASHKKEEKRDASGNPDRQEEVSDDARCRPTGCQCRRRWLRRQHALDDAHVRASSRPAHRSM